MTQPEDRVHIPLTAAWGEGRSTKITVSEWAGKAAFEKIECVAGKVKPSHFKDDREGRTV